MIKYIMLVPILLLLASCSGPNGNSTGHEYMPDMAHAVSVESNLYVDYFRNTFDKESVISRKDACMPRLPVMGSIPRGYTGIADAASPEAQDNMMLVLEGESASNGVRTPLNGSVPYYYGDNEDERARATKEISKNPFPITAKRLESGKELYVIYCAICHGEKGDGAGYLVRDNGGKYPAQPANFMTDPFIVSNEGRYYHAIMYGRNLMGGYADKLSYEERWNVIHYIKSLQAGVKGLVYNENENTFNNAVPFAKISKKVEDKKTVETKPAGDLGMNAPKAAEPNQKK